MHLCSLHFKPLFKLYQLNTMLYCKYRAHCISGSTYKYFFFLVKSCLIQVCGLSSYNHKTILKQESKLLNIIDFHTLWFSHTRVPKELISLLHWIYSRQNSACLLALGFVNSPITCLGLKHLPFLFQVFSHYNP